MGGWAGGRAGGRGGQVGDEDETDDGVGECGRWSWCRSRCKGAPMWTIGPSRPRGMLVLVMRVMPTTLATSVLGESMPLRMYVPVGWGRGWRVECGGRCAECGVWRAEDAGRRMQGGGSVPLRYDLSLGSPELPAEGAHSVSNAARSTISTLSPV